MADLDPISAAASQMNLAPTQGTDYFAPEDTIMARYANTQIADSQTPQLAAASQQAAQTPLQHNAWTTQDREFHDRQNWRVARGQFLGTLATQLQPTVPSDPTNPDSPRVPNPNYTDQRAKVLSTLNPVALNDPAVHSILSATDAEHHGALAFQHQQAQIQSRSAAAADRYYHERILPNLSPEDAQGFIDEWTQNQQQNPGTTGLPASRMLYWGQKATATKHDTKLEGQKDFQEYKAQLTQQQKERDFQNRAALAEAHDLAHAGMKRWVEGDNDAFPLQAPNFIAAKGSTVEAIRKSPDGATLLDKENWDKHKYDSELGEAIKDTKDVYVAKGGAKVMADPALQQKRADLWDYAQKHFAFKRSQAETPAATPDQGAQPVDQSTQQPVTPPAAPAAPTQQPVTPPAAPQTGAPEAPKSITSQDIDSTMLQVLKENPSWASDRPKVYAETKRRLGLDKGSWTTHK